MQTNLDANVRERILTSARRRFRIGPGWAPTPFYERGRKCAHEYWSGPHRHPATPLRALLKETRASREWLDASWGHFERTREIDAEIGKNPRYADELIQQK